MTTNKSFAAVLLAWYEVHGRALPWRATAEPYRIWLSEVLLQQTRVEQGMPYYEKFVAAYPTVGDLAAAPLEQLMKLWQGLGYYSRCRNLHHTAQYIVNELAGEFPTTSKQLLALKGVGAYTAAAVASICFGEAVAVVDGNVYRVLSRYFGITTAVDTTLGKKQFQELATSLLPLHDVGSYNQAIMDFGALCCTPSLPGCGSCPLSQSCVALALGKVKELPAKQKRVRVQNRYLNYFIVEDVVGNVQLLKRKDKDIWQGLYEFVLFESEAEPTLTQIESYAKQKWGAEVRAFAPSIKHQLTHQRLFVSFWGIQLSTPKKEFVPIEELHSYAVPKPLEQVVQLLQQRCFAVAAFTE